MSVIKTYNESGLQNGVVIPLWHVDSGIKVDQVYLTTVLAESVKGPHLHKVRRGLFACIKGEVIAVTRNTEGEYTTTSLQPGDPLFEVPPGTPAAFYNTSAFESYLLNMPSPPWREDDKDEWPVEDWDYRGGFVKRQL